MERIVSLESVPGVRAPVNVALVQRFAFRIIRVELAGFLAQRLMELKLNDVAHEVSDIRDVSDDVILASRVEILFRSGYGWLDSLIRISATDAS